MQTLQTLKSRIEEAVMEYHDEKDAPPDPQVLSEAIIEILRDFFADVLSD